MDRTLVDVAHRRAAERGDQPAYIFLADGETESERLSHGALDQAARALAAALVARGLAGQRVLLLFPPGLDFIIAFLGCLQARVVAVPAYPPHARRGGERLVSIAKDCRPALALTSVVARRRAAAVLEPMGIPCVSTDQLLEDGGGEGPEEIRAPVPEDPAFLQYTSGSTAAPRGVIVPHGALLHNQRAIAAAFGHDEATVVVSWLPLYHDMGLIGGVLQPLFLGARCILMAPTAFLKRPRRWLEAIQRYRGTTSGAPNFAYQLCVERIPEVERAGLDLSSWRVAFNGAEPVRAATLESFAEGFAPHGFRREALYPCYGLAEATLLVSGGSPATAPRVLAVAGEALEQGRVEVPGSRSLVSCGAPQGDLEVRLVEPETGRPAAPGTVAEIWLRGSSVCPGYWDAPEATAATFGGRIEGESSTATEPLYLRTGDLGFLDGGELFLAGRLKDLIILRGRNIYPQDVEAVVEASHSAVRTGGVAAFGWDAEGEERLVVLAEVERTIRHDRSLGVAILEQAREGLSDALDVIPYGLVLLPPGGLPLTTSGKVRRHAARDRLAGRQLKPILEWWAAREPIPRDPARAALELPPAPRPGDPVEKVERWLLARLAVRLGVGAGAELDLDRSVVGYGLDSLAAIELEHEIESALGVRLPMAAVLEAPTLRHLAAELHRRFERPPELADIVSRAAPDGDHPVTDGQRALYYLHELRRSSPAYNLVTVVEIEGAVTPEGLARGVAALVRHNAALRTTFHAPTGRPVQRVAPVDAVEGDGWRQYCDFQLLEAVAGTSPEWTAELARRGEAPFDLERGPLLRCHGQPLGPGRFAVLLALHHIVGDLWSLTLLLRQLVAALATGSAPDQAPDQAPARGADPVSDPGLPEAGARFTDYARWQDRRLAGAEGERLWGYWKAALPGALPELELPTDRPRPPTQTFRGATRLRSLPAVLGEELVALSSSVRSTLFMALVAGLEVVLARYTGQGHFLLGTLSSGRDREAFRHVVGFLVNTLVLRADVSPHASFRDHLQGVRDTALGAFAHQDWPFSRLVEALKPVRDLSRSPLFQVLFSLQSAPLPTAPGDGEGGEEESAGLARFILGAEGGILRLGGLTLRSVALPRRIAQFDLSVMAAGGQGGPILLSAEYNADLFDATTVDRLLQHLEVLLRGAVAAPDAALARLPLLSTAEAHQLRWEHNDTACFLGEDSILPTILARMARVPDAVAVRMGERVLSYRQLDQLSGTLALQMTGHSQWRSGIEMRVGVALERSLELPVALLAILRAGAAYVPLAPRHPPDRLADLVTDAGIPLYLEAADRPLAIRGAVALGVDLDALERRGAEGTLEPATEAAIDAAIHPQAIAYVLYTSGSTGRPKGVMSRHRSLANRLRWMQRQYALGEGDRVLQKTPFTFDVSVWEFFWPWMTGAEVVMAPPGAHRDAAHLVRLIGQQRITVVHFVPPMLRVWLAEDTVGECAATLRVVIASGEALPLQLVNRFFAALPGVALENLYGPTEAAIDVTWWSARPGVSVVPIGRPIDNVRIHLLDRRGRPVPIGVPGELFIGGVNLGRGYLGEPRRTASRFRPDPFGGNGAPGSRLYRTGDRVRRETDGMLTFLGRLDHQVKLRGFRIEPGEVEALLARHPAVHEAAVLLQDTPLVAALPEDEGGREALPGPVRRFQAGRGTNTETGDSSTARLVAYFTHSGGSGVPSGSELRRFLARTLPEYMIPSFFVPLESMPLTATGKLDRLRLPTPGRQRPRLDVALALPQEEEEELLADIWSRVLQVDQVGIDDNFFELGGDSIRSIQIRSQLAAQGWRVTLDDLLRYQTIRELARLLKAAPQEAASATGGDAQPFPLLSPEERTRVVATYPGVEDAYPLSRTQAGVLFHAQYDPGSPLYRNIFLCRVEGPCRPDSLAAAVQGVVDRHPVLRTSFDLAEFSEPLQLVWRPDQGPDGGPITARLEAEQVASSQEVMAWIDREKERPLDWDQLPMVRFAVLRGPSPEDPGKEVFHLALSYVDALLDGWSTTSLLAEVLHRYDRILSGAEPAPEELATVSFRDFVAAERRAMADPESGAFWQRELAGVEATDIVRWGEAAEARSGGGGKESMVLLDVPVPRATVTALEGVARQARTAIKHVLLAAHLQVLSLFSGRTLVSSGVESNGRLEEAGGDLALGMHVNILPFCARLAGGRWVDLVRQVFETERHMLPHRRFPLFEIQKQHGGELARVVFNFTHFHVLQRLEGLRGLRVLDADGFDQTNFLLRADFNRNPFTEALQLSLTGSGGWLGKVDLGRLGDAYLHVLKSMARNPAARYERQSFLHPAERHQLRCEWNDTNLPFIAVDALQAVFEVQAARRPTAVALEYGDSRWSYDRLDGASNRLAHHLRRLGVKPEVPVAICLPRGPYLVASVLAVLKAGGAYVPLDPTHPAERVAHLMKDSAAKVLITERPLVGQLPDSGAVTVYLDEAREALLARPRTPVQRLTTASHLAYILYTSGSTGRPKGVAVSHGAAINLCAAMLRKLRFQSSDAMLSLTTLSFDISVLELFLPLSCGARVVITPQSTAMDGLELARLVHASGVTMMQATPATYRFLVDVGWSGGEALTLLCGGEALSLDLARALGERCRALWNVYGPTETTVWSAADRVVPPLHPTGPLAVTIGRGLANTQLYVLDAQGRRTLPGVPGELYIGGHGVARGYWGKPALTAERFLPDPFGGRAGARLYRTGDLVRYLPDGRLEFLRRVDNQLKIQGHRIEPSEVEGVLEAHPQIRQAVVAARSLPSGHRQLVGYLRFEDSTGNPGAAELREVLRQRLPSYMIPATFVTVDRFPVNASGKVDRSRLPAPARPRRTALELQRFLEQLGRLSEAEAQTFLAQRLRE